MKKLTVRLRWSASREVTVGQLAEANHRVYFEFDAEFLRGSLQLSPFKWPLRSGLIEHTDLAFGPLPGWADDSLPDGWGLLLIDRMFRRSGLDPAAVSPIERLSYLGSATMGALTYHPPVDGKRSQDLIDLHEMGKNAQAVFAGEAVEVLPELLRAGGSPAGARPKALIGVKGKEILSGEADLPAGFEHWIIKFAVKGEGRDAGAVELAYANMARAAGIDMPPTRLFKAGKGLSCFGVRRFDRGPGNSRIHAHTFGNLIQTNFRIPSCDYADLLKVTSALTRDHQELRRMCRRMLFNIAAHNRDDHAKNFAFLMNERGEWTLSPAYDLVCAAGPGGEHTMTVMGEGRAPGREHAIRLMQEFGVKRKQVEAIIDEVNEAVARWHQFADEAGCTKRTIKRIASQIDPL